MDKINNVNDLPTEVKLMIVQGQTLVDDTKRKVSEQFHDVDLTCRMQLKSDSREVEMCIKKIYKGKANEKDIEKLKLAITRLETTSGGILR